MSGRTARPADELPAGPVTLVRYRGGEEGALLAAVAANLDHLRPWMPWAAAPPTLATLADFVRRCLVEFETGAGFGYWLREEETGDLVGGAGLHGRLGPGALEIGYWVHAGRTRRGYASAAAAALTTAALGIDGVHRVEIHCDEANVASASVPRRLGYRLAAVVDDEVEAPGESGRSMIWLTDAAAWAVMPSSSAPISRGGRRAGRAPAGPAAPAWRAPPAGG